MKNINRIITAVSGIALSLVMMTSCDLLDITQDNKLSASNMWKDATDVTTAANGIYYRMRSNFVSNYCNVFYWGELRVGDYMWGPSLESNANNADMIGVRTSTMTGTTESTKWSALYTAIDQANSVLKYAPKVTMTASDRGFAVGQAAFARAYCYFWAARMWGDVPLNLVPIESSTQPETYPTRTPKAQVYAQIKADIDTALNNSAYLGANKYLATEDAVNMLKAEFGLWMYSTQAGGNAYLDYAEAALDAIGISSTRLLKDFSDVFDRSHKCNNEVVFALNNNQTEGLLGGYYWFYYYPSNLVGKEYQQNPVPINATQWLSYSQEFVDTLRASESRNNDIRVACNLGYGPYGSGDGHIISWPNKFLGDMSSSITINDCDLLYYRYAYAVMMDAELKYYKGDYSGALQSLNLIAARAYGKTSFYKDASKEAVCDALVREYFLEFPSEGVIWWALVRLDKIWDYNEGLSAKKASNPNILLWPISTSAINKNNKLTQTQGWS